MRLVYFGTPEFASRCLQKILSSNHEVVAVVTAPDRPVGRGRKISQSEVRKLAQAAGLEVLQPANLKERSFLERLESFRADLFCVVAYRILPEEVFSMPSKGCINLHASLLPRYRGAAPINWVLINGEKETGVTSFFIRRKVDTGDIILQEKARIGPDETFGELHDRLAELGGEVLVKTLDRMESGDLRLSGQDDSLASAAPKITAETGRIDWSEPAVRIHNLVRGLSPRPGASCFVKGKRVTILRTRLEDGRESAEPGTTIEADPKSGIVVACGQGSIRILQLKPESGKVMAGEEYVRGYRLKAAERFTNEKSGIGDGGSLER
jgi:methionyl-tRNA formyltransferase